MHLKTLGAIASVAVVFAFRSNAAAAPEKLMDPAKLTAKAPDTFKAKFDTTKGIFVIEVHRDWAPNGVDRFYNLVKNGYYDGVKFFRVVPGFVAQWGIHGDPAIAMKWLKSTIPDDAVKQSNLRGYVTYAKSGAPNSRSVQLFINLADNPNLDGMGFAPFGKVIDGMDVVGKLFDGYADGLRSLQGRIAEEGNAFLEKTYPNLDTIKRASIE
jgi:peptidyl-prolyl cis-trans isomerase A (cyclophilin A)